MACPLGHVTFQITGFVLAYSIGYEVTSVKFVLKMAKREFDAPEADMLQIVPVNSFRHHVHIVVYEVHI